MHVFLCVLSFLVVVSQGCSSSVSVSHATERVPALTNDRLCFHTPLSKIGLSFSTRGKACHLKASVPSNQHRAFGVNMGLTARRSKLNKALNSAEEKKNGMIVWNEELVVLYLRILEQKQQESKSVVRKVWDISTNLITRLLALFLLKFWAGVCSVLRVVQSIRPKARNFEENPEALNSSAGNHLASSPSLAVSMARNDSDQSLKLHGNTRGDTSELKAKAGNDMFQSTKVEESKVASPANQRHETVEVSDQDPITIANVPASEKELLSMEQMRHRIESLSNEQRATVSTVWVDRLKEPEMAYELLSYVRASKSRDEECWNMILKSGQWREEFGMDEVMQDEGLTIEGFFGDETREVDWLPPNADRSGEGNPVLLYRSAAHVPLNRPTDEWLRFFVHQCEAARLSHPGKQVVILVDRVGSGKKNQDPTVLRALAPIITEHFPLLIGRVYVAPVNTVLFIIWSVVSFILDEQTKSVIQLVQGANWKEKLADKVLPAALPHRLGGTNHVF